MEPAFDPLVKLPCPYRPKGEEKLRSTIRQKRARTAQQDYLPGAISLNQKHGTDLSGQDQRKPHIKFTFELRDSRGREVRSRASEQTFTQKL